MQLIKASVITIGDELLIGQVIDTNSSYIARRLGAIGITVSRRIAVGDEEKAIFDVLNSEGKTSQVVLITGGLGPTKDDKTKAALCRYFNGKIIINEGALQNVKYLFEKVYNKPVSAVNLAQAEVPDVCEVLQNKRGSAPGMIFKKENTIFISMPGVPYEMYGIMDDVIPYLEKAFALPQIIHKTILTAGIGESALAELISDFENNLPPDISLAYLPNYGMVRLRLSITGYDRKRTSELVETQFAHLKLLVHKYLVTDEDNPMQVVLGKILKTAGKTIATAESCTGGAIASLITSVPGSSAWYPGSIVSYSNEVKTGVLQVKSETIRGYGAVSEETVTEMLSGVLKIMNTDYAIAVSGIMGPDGGTPEKPVGTVWVAVGNRKKCVARRLNLRFERLKNIEVTSVAALNLVREFILDSL